MLVSCHVLEVSSVKPNSSKPPELVNKMENCVDRGTIDVVRVINKFLQQLLILPLTTRYCLFEGDTRSWLCASSKWIISQVVWLSWILIWIPVVQLHLILCITLEFLFPFGSSNPLLLGNLSLQQTVSVLGLCLCILLNFFWLWNQLT